jgi:sulfur carrier protein
MKSMQIQLNGEATAVTEGLSVAVLLEQLALSGRRLAVECNGELVPRSQHAEHTLSAGDRIEIVEAMGGG